LIDNDDYAALREYAPIGDGRTIALVRRDGAIDWFPIERHDSEPVFARLLDAENGGYIALCPRDGFEATREYIRGTNVLRTTFTTASGQARVTDALVIGFAGRLPWVELVRRIEGLRGSVAFIWRVVPGTRLATASPWVEPRMDNSVIRCGGVVLSVQGLDHGESQRDLRSLSGRFETSEGSRHLLVVAGAEEQPVHIPVPALSDEGLDRTIRTWQLWSEDFRYDGRWSAAVQRSALMLKLLIHEPTGAIAAAATTSLPERLGGDKNWDYRLGWVRDSALAVQALIRFGLREEPHAAVGWLVRAIKRHGPRLHIFYALDGGLPAGVEERAVPGWRGIQPVLAGNRANAQVQLGVYGYLMRLMRVYVEAGNLLDPGTAELLRVVADEVTGLWRQPDSGIWELPETRHYTSSKMGCWQALVEAVRMHERGVIRGDVEHWRAEAESIRAWVLPHCWSAPLQSYTWWAGSHLLDASVLLHAPSGFDDGPRMASTARAVAEELGRGPLLFRYSGAREEEGCFVACSFWMVSALAAIGQKSEAAALMDELVELANDVGMYSEMIDPDDGALLGNLPQALSHLALIDAAVACSD
jgi:GH15 family glucan-1,4-alpha-glucosidase